MISKSRFHININFGIIIDRIYFERHRLPLWVFGRPQSPSIIWESKVTQKRALCVHVLYVTLNAQSILSGSHTDQRWWTSSMNYYVIDKEQSRDQVGSRLRLDVTDKTFTEG